MQQISDNVTYHCSFCDKSQADVVAIITDGMGHCICNGCVAAAVAVLGGRFPGMFAEAQLPEVVEKDDTPLH